MVRPTFFEENNMSSRQTEQKVREFEMTLEDARRLAECLNSFDDSDSWPGGFTHGNPYTAERVLESWSKQKNIRVIVGYSGDKIVGHCNISDAELDPEASYVGLLGVSPHFQGQGYGKAMLIAAAQAAADAGKRRVDLHTWGGNLKAMPLYKRIGYNWVPGTRVLMESHIPGIIGAEMFQPFFERYDWYDSLKVDVTQEIDDFVDDGIGIFRYRFEGENGDKLYVTVDREVKGICGFVLTLDNETLSVHIRPKNHIGYIGLGASELDITLKNEMKSDQHFSIDINPNKDVSVKFNSALKGNLASGKDLVIMGSMEIVPNTRMIDRDLDASEKAKTQSEFVVTLGDRQINLYSGLIPIEAISPSTSPHYPCIAPGKESMIGIGLQNNTQDTIRGKITFSAPETIILKESMIDFEVKPGTGHEVPLQLTTSVSDDNPILPIKLSITVEQESDWIHLLDKTLNIPVLGISGAVVYEGIGNQHMLETESIRLGLRKTPSMALTYLEYKPLNEVITGWGHLPDIGYPFSGEGSEWYRAEFDVAMTTSDKTAELTLTAVSEERPGLKYTIIHRVHSGLETFDTIIRLENTGTQTFSNLGLRIDGWFRFGPDQMYVPLRNEIVSLNAIDWNGRRQLPRTPQEYHENWVARSKQATNLTMGQIWSQDFIERLYLNRSFNTPTFEYKLPDMAPGDVLEFNANRTIMTQGNWEKIRSIWTRTQGTSEVQSRDDRDEPRSDLELELVRTGSGVLSGDISPVLIDRNTENEMEFRLRVVHEEAHSASCVLRMPDGLLINGESELSFKIENVDIDNPYRLPVKITSNEVKDWFVEGGEIYIEFPSRILRLPIDFVIYDSKLRPKRSTTTEDTSELMTTEIGRYSFAVSPQNVGGLVRYNRTGDSSMFFDTFPKVDPFIWWDKAYSGLTPVLVGFDIWNWESGLAEETWDVTEIALGPWFGYEVSSVLKHTPGLKGMTAKLRYLLLAGTPLLRMEIELENTSGLWKLPYIGFRGFPTPGGDIQSKVHTVYQGHRIQYEPTGNEADIWAFPEAGWGVYEGLTSGRILGFLSTSKCRESLALDTLGDKAHLITLRSQPRIPAGEKSSLVVYLLDAESIEQVECLKHLPKRIE